MGSSSAGDDCEGLGGMEVEIADQMEDPPRELIPVIEEDSDDIPILGENQDPIPVPPPHIRNTENVEIVKMASQVSRQCCIRLLGQISRQTPCLGTIGTEHLHNNLSRQCCVGRPSSLHTESNIRILREAREDSPSDGVTNRTSSSDVAGGSSLSPESL